MAKARDGLAMRFPLAVLLASLLLLASLVLLGLSLPASGEARTGGGAGAADSARSRPGGGGASVNSSSSNRKISRGGASPGTVPQRSRGGANVSTVVQRPVRSRSTAKKRAVKKVKGRSRNTANSRRVIRRGPSGGASPKAAARKPKLKPKPKPRKPPKPKAPTKKIVKRVVRKPKPAPKRRPTPTRPTLTQAPSTSKGVFPIKGRYTYGDGIGVARPGNRLHQGQDIAAQEGTPLVSPKHGTVTWRAYQPSGAGHYLVIRDSRGWDYVFMHLKHGSILVNAGSPVRAGQKIAEVGSTGASSGPHLHFEIWPNGWRTTARSQPKDPMPELRAWERRRR